MSEMKSSTQYYYTYQRTRQLSNESSLVEKEQQQQQQTSGAAAMAAPAITPESPNNNTVRRKLERFRSKLIELFFTSSSSSNQSVNSPPLTPLSPSSVAAAAVTGANMTSSTTNSTTMSNYYFGYTSTSSTSRVMMSFDATSTSSSLTSDDSNSSSASSALTSASLPITHETVATTTTRQSNAFLNSLLTSRFIHLNTPDLNLLRSQFEPFMCTIDDEDNFFDAEFMSAYIAYTLVTRLREHASLELRQIVSGDQQRNLVYEIARDIFAQSECEPCGLKGCRINLILDSSALDNSDDENSLDVDMTNNNRILLDRFRFDSTCLLTFELNLVLKQVSSYKNNNSQRPVDLNNNSSSSSQSNSTNRKNSSKSVKFSTTANPFNRPPVKNNTNSISTDSVVYLDDTHFNLYKCSLY